MNKNTLLSVACAALLVPSVVFAADAKGASSTDGNDAAAASSLVSKLTAGFAACFAPFKKAGTFGVAMANPMSYINCAKNVWNAEEGKLAAFLEDKAVLAGLSVATIAAVLATIYKDEIVEAYEELKEEYFATEAEANA